MAIPFTTNLICQESYARFSKYTQINFLIKHSLKYFNTLNTIAMDLQDSCFINDVIKVSKIILVPLDLACFLLSNNVINDISAVYT